MDKFSVLYWTIKFSFHSYLEFVLFNGLLTYWSLKSTTLEKSGSENSMAGKAFMSPMKQRLEKYNKNRIEKNLFELK